MLKAECEVVNEGKHVLDDSLIIVALRHKGLFITRSVINNVIYWDGECNSIFLVKLQPKIVK